MNSTACFQANASDIQEMVDRIVSVSNPEKIILFGSYAKGTARPHSDVDLLVVDTDDFGAFRSRRDVLRKIGVALKGIRVPKDVLLYSHREFMKWRGISSHIVGSAFQEGKLLYEK